MTAIPRHPFSFQAGASPCVLSLFFPFSLSLEHPRPSQMYSEQSLLPPPLPGSPPRFTLPPIGSPPRFSTTLPRLPYTGSATQRESGADNNVSSSSMNKGERWKLPPLSGLSSTSSNYQAPFSYNTSSGASSAGGSGTAYSFSPYSYNNSSTFQAQPQPSLGYRYEAEVDHPPPVPSIWRSTNGFNNNNDASTVPRSQPSSSRQRSPRFLSTPVPDDPYYYYGEEGNRSGDWDDTNEYTSTSSSRAAEYTERTLEINHEFLENKETIYLEKIKRLQEELSAIQHGGHEVFEEHITDLEDERTKEISKAQLMMEYRIQCAEKLYSDALRAVEEEAEVEKRELKKAMLFIIDEKRKRIKEYRDEDIILSNDFVVTAPQTRNRRRTRGAAATAVASITEGSLTLEQLLSMNKNGVKTTTKRRNNDHILFLFNF
ncbi:Sds3-like-domain-containing protein [Fennellomyces sp. T-0311]|nr:Sds3-like-domain-containing protein [Fennellomyces sp. T-0311]